MPPTLSSAGSERHPEHDFWGSSGTGGYSDLKAHTTMLQVDAPLADGRMFFRTDRSIWMPAAFPPTATELLAQLGHLWGDRLYQRQ